MQGTFKLVAGDLSEGTADVTVTNENGRIVARAQGNELSGPATDMAALAEEILAVTGRKPRTTTEAKAFDLTGFYAQRDEYDFTVFDADGNVVAKFVENPGTHSIALD